MTELVTYAGNVLRQIDERLRSAEQAILSGQAPNYEAYKKQVGVREGLMQARSEIVGLLGEDAKHLKTSHRD